MYFVLDEFNTFIRTIICVQLSISTVFNCIEAMYWNQNHQLSNSSPPPNGCTNGVESCQSGANCNLQNRNLEFYSTTAAATMVGCFLQTNAICWPAAAHCGKKTAATCLELTGISHKKLKTVCPSGIIVLFFTELITRVRSRKAENKTEQFGFLLREQRDR